MRVSRLLGFLILVTLVGIGLVIAPVTAGEHPWNDDQYADTTRMVANNSGSEEEPETPEEPKEPNVGEDYLGSSLFFWNLLINDPYDISGELDTGL